MAGNSEYSIHDIVNVFRSIARLVQNMPHMLDTMGVFRIGGSKLIAQQRVKELIDSQFDWESLKDYILTEHQINSDCVHNIMTMCNIVLKNAILLNANDPLLAPFAKKLHALLDTEKADDEKHETAMMHIDQFINSLLLSHSIDYQRIGETLYHYCYLMHTAATYEDTNKMGAHNLAIIMSPHFTYELELFHSEDLLSLTKFSMEKLTPVLELYIRDERTASHFLIQHADKLEHLKETRLKIIDKLREMKAANRKYTVEPMKDLMNQSKELIDQTSLLQKKLKTEHLEKNETKQIKKKLHELQFQLAELESQIIVLKEKIDEMNFAHASLLAEIQKLSLSITRFTPLDSSEDPLPSSNNQISERLQFGLFKESASDIALTSNDDLSIEHSDATENALI